MNRYAPRALVAALALALMPAAAPAAESSAGPAAIEAKMAQMSGEIERLKADLARAIKENDSLKTELNRHRSDKTDLQVENKRLEELAGLTAKGDVVASAAALIKPRYDSASDTTVVASTPQKVLGDNSAVQCDHFLSYEYAYRGQEMAAPPDSVTFVIQAYFRPNTRYASARALTFTVDGEKLAVPLVSYELTKTHRTPSPVAGTTRYNESLRFKLDEAALQALARADNVTVNIEGNELPVSRDMLATARAMRERIRIAR